jgi:hypothetical protein
MALMKCRSCGSEVATDAVTCPKCGAPTKKKMGIVKMVLVVIGSLFLLCIVGNIFGGKKDRGATATPPPPPAAPVAAATPAPAPPSPDAPAAVPPTQVAAPPASEYDAIGTEKTWASLTATLKEVSASGKTGRVSLLLKNDGDEEETISSLAYFNATNQEGDVGKLDWTTAKCDGAVPPKGIFKCKLAFKFDTAVKEMTVRVGAGIMTKTTYFKVKVGK